MNLKRKKTSSHISIIEAKLLKCTKKKIDTEFGKCFVANCASGQLEEFERFVFLYGYKIELRVQQNDNCTVIFSD